MSIDAESRFALRDGDDSSGGGPPHVLVVGGVRGLHAALDRLAVASSTTVMCPPEHVGFIRPEALRRLIVSQSGDHKEWLTLAKAVHDIDRVDAVLSVSDAGQWEARAIASMLDLSFHEHETLRAVHDKSVMRRHLADSGVDILPHAVASSEHEIDNTIRVLGLPAIIKPLHGGGSVGVTVIRRAEDLDGAKKRVRPYLDADGAVLIEAFLEGPEFSVETLSERGVHFVLAVVRKATDEVHRVELGHVLPAALSPSVLQGVNEYVRTVLSALGVRNGVCHTEIILTKDGPRIVETHLRPAGDRIPTLLEAALGIDCVGLLVAQAFIGTSAFPVSATSSQSGDALSFAAIRFVSPGAGTVRAVHGLDAARSAPHVTSVEQFVETGTVVADEQSSLTRGAMVTTTASSESAAWSAAEHAASLIRFEVGQ